MAKSQKYRVFSTNFPAQMSAHEGKCFVPMEDVRDLEDKYYKLFKRYQREQKRDTAGSMWKRFIDYLTNVADPIVVMEGKGKDAKKVIKPHVSFLGSIEKYRKIFLEANK